mgnify:FL=1
MGIFSRQNDNDNNDEELSHVDLPTQNDLSDDFLDNSEFTAPRAPQKSLQKPDYDIEKAIRLMSALPEGETQLVVTIVRQTLESMDVDVGDIIQDAECKEKRLNDRHQKLRHSIRDFEAKIADKNQQIKVLLEDLKETSKVKQQLQLTQNEDKPVAAPTPSPSTQQNSATEKITSTEPSTQTAKQDAPTRPKPMH